MDSSELIEYISKKTGLKNDVVDFVINDFNQKLLDVVLNEGDLIVSKLYKKVRKIEIVASDFTDVSLFKRKQIMSEGNLNHYHYLYFNSPAIDKKQIKIKLNNIASKKVIKHTALTKKEYRYVN